MVSSRGAEHVSPRGSRLSGCLPCQGCRHAEDWASIQGLMQPDGGLAMQQGLAVSAVRPLTHPRRCLAQEPMDTAFGAGCVMPPLYHGATRVFSQLPQVLG